MPSDPHLRSRPYTDVPTTTSGVRSNHAGLPRSLPLGQQPRVRTHGHMTDERQAGGQAASSGSHGRASGALGTCCQAASHAHTELLCLAPGTRPNPILVCLKNWVAPLTGQARGKAHMPDESLARRRHHFPQLLPCHEAPLPRCEAFRLHSCGPARLGSPLLKAHRTPGMVLGTPGSLGLDTQLVRQDQDLSPPCPRPKPLQVPNH